jgi:hypothetical protein
MRIGSVMNYGDGLPVLRSELISQIGPENAGSYTVITPMYYGYAQGRGR